MSFHSFKISVKWFELAVSRSAIQSIVLIRLCLFSELVPIIRGFSVCELTGEGVFVGEYPPVLRLFSLGLLRGAGLSGRAVMSAM